MIPLNLIVKYDPDTAQRAHHLLSRLQQAGALSRESDLQMLGIVGDFLTEQGLGIDLSKDPVVGQQVTVSAEWLRQTVIDKNVAQRQLRETAQVGNKP